MKSLVYTGKPASNAALEANSAHVHKEITAEKVIQDWTFRMQRLQRVCLFLCSYYLLKKSVLRGINSQLLVVWCSIRVRAWVLRTNVPVFEPQRPALIC